MPPKGLIWLDDLIACVCYFPDLVQFACMFILRALLFPTRWVRRNFQALGVKLTKLTSQIECPSCYLASWRKAALIPES